MKKFNFENSILQKGKVVEVKRHKGKVDVQLPDGPIKEIFASSARAKNKSPLEKGEEVVFVFHRGQIRYTAERVREHVLAQIIYPHDKEYPEILNLEKNPDSKREHPVEEALRKKRAEKEKIN